MLGVTIPGLMEYSLKLVKCNFYYRIQLVNFNLSNQFGLKIVKNSSKSRECPGVKEALESLKLKLSDLHESLH